MKIEVIRKHLFLNDIFPAVLLNNGEIRIMIKHGQYWPKDKFIEQAALGLPYSETEIMEISALYDADYSSYLMDNTREVIHQFRILYRGSNPSSLKMSPLTMCKMFEQFEKNFGRTTAPMQSNMFMGIPIITEDWLPEGSIYAVK